MKFPTRAVVSAMILGGAGLLQQSTLHAPSIVHKNRGKVESILGMSDYSRVDKIGQMVQEQDLRDPTVRRIIKSEVLDPITTRNIVFGNITLRIIRNEDGTSVVDIIESGEAGVRIVFSDTNGDGLFDETRVEKNGVVVSHNPCTPEDIGKADGLLEKMRIIQLQYK